jgi:hypothetical protein
VICEPKWWPQGSSFSSSKTKQRTHKAERDELGGLVVHVNVRIGLIDTYFVQRAIVVVLVTNLLFFSEEIQTKWMLKRKEKKGRKKKMFRKDTT